MEYNMFNKVQNIGAITLHDYEDKFIVIIIKDNI